jgi:hypothetical protein
MAKEVRYFRGDRHALFDHMLSGPEKLTLFAISSYADDTGFAFPSMATIAARLGIGRATVKRHVARLVEVGYLSKQRRLKTGGGWSSNGYFVNVQVAPVAVTQRGGSPVTQRGGSPVTQRGGSPVTQGLAHSYEPGGRVIAMSHELESSNQKNLTTPKPLPIRNLPADGWAKLFDQANRLTDFHPDTKRWLYSIEAKELSELCMRARVGATSDEELLKAIEIGKAAA